MKLELKHLAPYLPFNLKANITGLDGKEWLNVELTSLSTIESYEHACFLDMRKGKDLMPGELSMIHIENVKPILKPLTDITNELDKLARDVTLFLRESSKLPQNGNDLVIDGLMYSDVMILIRNHFDVFGLIEKGLAIDINTL